MMITLEGKSVFGGVAIGKIQFYKRNEITIKRTRVEDVEAEVERFQNAKAKTLELLKGLYEKALEDVGEANAMIFEAHQLMLEDPDYVESIENIIRTQDVNAEYAIGATADNFAAIATIGTPDILIVDEVLSVGDFRFQQKCEQRIHNMKEKGTTILFVSHSIDQVKSICNKIVWLEKGRVKRFGDVESICEEYRNSY